MDITKDQIKETLKTVMAEEADYKLFFKKALEKAGKSIPSMSDEEKKAFFNKIDNAWDAKGEKNEALKGDQHKLDVDGDGEIEASDLAALRAGKTAEDDVNEEKPGLWANIRAKKARGEKPAHGNSQAHKDAVKAGKAINKKNESVGCGCGCGGCNESIVTEGKHDVMLDKLADIVKDSKSFMDIGSELKKNGIKYSFSTNMLPMYLIDKPTKIAILNKKYADGAERVVGSTAIGLMESVNESASRTAMEIGGYTGLNKNAVQKFVDDNKLDIEKLYQFVKKGKLSDRLKLVSAIAGKPNNPVQKNMIQQFGEVLSKELAFEVITFMERPIVENILNSKFETKDVIDVLVNEGIQNVLTDGVKAEFDTLVTMYNK